MRNSTLLDALFPATRQAILATLLPDPDRAWYLSHLASHLQRSPSSLQRELESLVAVGILDRRQEGNHVYFQANRECPVYRELATLFEKTSGLVDAVRRALAPLTGRIRVSFVHGSVARGDEHAASDIDLVIVGEVGLADVAPELHAAEQQLGRPINPIVYSSSEFKEKVERGHHFLASVLEREKIFLIGSEHDLAELARGEARSAAHYEQAGAG